MHVEYSALACTQQVAQVAVVYSLEASLLDKWQPVRQNVLIHLAYLHQTKFYGRHDDDCDAYLHTTFCTRLTFKNMKWYHLLMEWLEMLENKRYHLFYNFLKHSIHCIFIQNTYLIGTLLIDDTSFENSLDVSSQNQ